MAELELQIFISSPGDVAEERALAGRVISRLSGEFGGRVKLTPIFWEHEPLLATAGFQDQIVSPAETDMVVCILWSRLGTRLPPQFTRPDGSRYRSGTEFEFEEAVGGHRKRGKPDLLVYRKTSEPVVSLADKDELLRRLEQKEALDRFVNNWFHDEAEGTLVAAFHAFNAPDQFEQLLELHLRKIITQRLPEVPAGRQEPPPPALWQKGSPFRGLDFFDHEHAPVFFGRTRAVSEVLAALRAQAAAGRPFVLVLGMSGGGKSSAVRAGVIPMLTQPGVMEGIGLWRRAVTRPGDGGGDPLLSLAASLLADDALPELARAGNTPQELARVLAESPAAAAPLIRTALSQAADSLAQRSGLERPPQARLALVVDQAEEIFTRPEIGPERRQALARALKALAESGLVWIVATMRSEFYPRLSELPDLVALKEGAGQYDLLPPSPAEIGQMIRQPALAAGLRLEVDPVSGERLEDLLRDAAVADPGVLPLLEFTLQELYARRERGGLLTLAACRALGGVEGALAQRAEEVFQDLPAGQKEAFPLVMRALVRVAEEGDGPVSGKRAPLDKVASSQEARGLISRLASARLLITDLAGDGAAVVRLGHEALLKHWPRLAELIDRDRDFLRARERVGAAARRWEQEKRSPDFLLAPGKPLEEGRHLLAERASELGQTQRAYIKASLARGRRRRNIKRLVAAALTALVLVAGLAAYQYDRSRREAQAEKERTTYLAEFLHSVFLDTGPDHLRGRAATVEDLLDSAARRVSLLSKNQPLNAARLMEVLGLSYTLRGRYAQALAAHQEVYRLRAQQLKPPHPLLAVSLRNLASAHLGQGNYPQAEKLARRALAMFIELQGEKSADTAYAKQVLAHIRVAQGGLDEAQGLLESSLEINRALQGKDSLAAANLLHDLGNLLMFRGRVRPAEDMARQALGIMARKLGPYHLKVILARVNLANMDRNLGRYHRVAETCPELAARLGSLLEPDHNQLSFLRTVWGGAVAELGRFDQAAQLFQAALRPALQNTDLGHPLLAGFLESYAQLLLSTQDFASAAPLLEHVRQVNSRAFGPRHPEVGRVLLELGAAHSGLGDQAQARKLFDQALEIVTGSLGEEHPLAGLGRLGQGICSLEQGDAKGAEPLLTRALEIISASMGPGHPLTAGAGRELARALAALGRLVPAEGLAVKALAVDREARGDKAPAVAADQRVLALVRMKQGDNAEAARLLGSALEIYETAFPPDNPEAVRTMELMAGLLDHQGRAAQAAQWKEKARAARQRWDQAERKQAAAFLEGIGRELRDQGQTDKAGKIFKLALEIYQRNLPAQHPAVIAALYQLAETHQVQGQYQPAQALYGQALELCRQAGRGDGLQAADNLYRLAQIAQARGNLEAAVSLHGQALGIYRARRGENHADTASTLHELAWLEHLRGRPAEARRLMEEAHQINRAIRRPEEYDYRATLGGMATLAFLQGDAAQAQQYYRELIPLQRKVLEPYDPALAASLASLGSLLLDQGRTEQAEPLVREALAIRERMLEPDHWQIANARSMLGVVLAAQGQDAAAEQLLLKGYEGLKAKLEPKDPRVGIAASRLASFYQSRNQPEAKASRERNWGGVPPQTPPQKTSARMSEIARAVRTAQADFAHPTEYFWGECGGKLFLKN